MRQRRKSAKADPGGVHPWCLVVAPLPPPVHGAALVNSFMVRELTKQAAAVDIDVVVCDNAPRATQGARYHLQRIRLNLAAVIVLLTGSARAGARPLSVYIGGAGGLGLVYHAVLVAMCRFLRVPTYYHHHSFAYVNERSLLMALIVKGGGRGLRHIYLGPTMQSRFDDRYRPRGPAYRCSNAVAVDRGAATLPAGSMTRADEPGPVLGHLSNLSRAKGLYDVMAAFDGVRGISSGARLRIAGGVSDPVEEADLETFCQRHGDAVDWRGPIPNSEVAPFMSGIDLLLFPSRYVNEAQPLVVLEAMREGTPVAAYDVGELATCIGAGGAVCEASGSFGDLVTDLVQMDEHERDHLKQLGHRAALQFDESLRAAEVDVRRIIDDLLSKPGR